MKKLFKSIYAPSFLLFCLFSIPLWGQNITQPTFDEFNDLEVNSYTGNLFYERSDLLITSQGIPTIITFTYNKAADTVDLGYGYGWSFNYHWYYQTDTSGLMIERGDGNRDLFVKTGNTFQAPTGVFDQLEEYASNQYKLTTRLGFHYYFDDPSHRKLTRMQNSNGSTLNFSYEGDQLVGINNSSGRNLSLVWEGGHLVEINDLSMERSLVYEYEEGRLISITDPRGNSEAYYYTEEGNGLTQVNDFVGNSTVITYDAYHRVKTLIACNGERTFGYGGQKSYMIEKGDGRNRIWTYEFDEDNQLISISNPNNQQLNYQYDAQKNVNQFNDLNGVTTSYSYDASGNTLSDNRADGNNLLFTYNELGRVTSVKDARGNSIQYTYDTKGNVTNVLEPQGVSSEFEYDAQGNLTASITPNGQRTTYEYDAAGNLIKAIFPIGMQQYEYDEGGNLTKFINADGLEYIYTYDEMERVSAIEEPDGSLFSYSFDPNGNVSETTNELGHKVQYFYNEEDALNMVQTADGVTEYEYNAFGQLNQYIDANGHPHQYQYDLLDNIETETDPLGNQAHYVYDSKSNLIETTDPNGQMSQFEYDKAEQVIKKSYPENTDHFEYDVVGNLVRAYNDDISLSYTYDELNRLINLSYDSWDKSIAYSYDAIGNRISMTDPDGGISSYTYDANNRLITLTNPTGAITRFEYGPAGRLTRKDQANGTYTTYAYTNSYLTNLNTYQANNQIFAGWTYTYDNRGNMLSKTDQSGLVDRYTYDHLDRLTRAEYADGLTEDFEYDKVGNRIRLMQNDSITNYVYDADNRLSSANDTEYCYDANGNLIEKTVNGQTRTYTYDSQNRLIQTRLPNGHISSIKYDPFGDKIYQSSTQGDARYYLHDGLNVLMELDANLNTDARYTTSLGTDSWLSMQRNGESYTFHKDAISSIHAISDENQQVVNSYSYRSFGEVHQVNATISNHYTYTGREYDDFCQFYYLRTRYLDAETGRFCSKDQFSGYIDLPQSLHKYTYVENNPVNYYDLVGEAKGGKQNITPTDLKGFDNPDDVDKYLEDKYPGPKNRGKRQKEKTKWEKGRGDRHSSQKKNRKSPKAKKVKVSKKAAQKTAGKVAKKAGGKVAQRIGGKIIRPLSIGIFAWNWMNGGPAYAINEELWPVSDMWRDDNGGGENSGGSGGGGSSGGGSGGGGGGGTGGGGGGSGNPNSPGGNSGGGGNSCGREEPPGPLPPPPGFPPSVQIPVLHAFDPNDIAGPIGYEEPRWVSVNEELSYTIRFENNPDFATAPAQRVTISLPIDEHQNIYAFRLSEFGFGDFRYQVPENTAYYTNRLTNTVDSLQVYVDVTAGIDVVNNQAFWIFESIDPATGLAPENALLGFLPVNDTTITRFNDSIPKPGEGFVSFSIKPIEMAITGDSINAQASIVFDDNEAIATNVWTNLIDAFGPVSQLDPLPAFSTSNTITISWSGEDDTGGVGLDYYDLYLSKDGGAFYLYQADIDTTEWRFSGTAGSTYSFYTRAIDYVNNEEAAKTVGDESITLGVDAPFIAISSPVANSAFCIGDTLPIAWQANLIDLVDIAISDDGGDNFENIAMSIDTIASPFLWPIPNSVFAGSNYLIQISDVATNSVIADSPIFELKPLPVIDLGNDTSLVEGSSFVLDAGNSGAEFIWSTGDTTQTITVSEMGIYSVSVTNAQACSNSDEISISISTSVDDISHIDQFQVYPNPTFDQLHIAYSLQKVSETSRFELRDALGRLVLSKTIREEALGQQLHQLALSNLPEGVYLLTVNIAGQERSTVIAKMK